MSRTVLNYYLVLLIVQERCRDKTLYRSECFQQNLSFLKSLRQALYVNILKWNKNNPCEVRFPSFSSVDAMFSAEKHGAHQPVGFSGCFSSCLIFVDFKFTCPKMLQAFWSYGVNILATLSNLSSLISIGDICCHSCWADGVKHFFCCFPSNVFCFG